MCSIFVVFEGTKDHRDIWPFNKHQRRLWIVAATKSNIQLSSDFLDHLVVSRSILDVQKNDIIGEKPPSRSVSLFCEIMSRRSLSDYKVVMEYLSWTNQLSVVHWFDQNTENG
jgi:hypothetical protein